MARIEGAKNNRIQFLRGLAIIAVVLIHTCPSGMWQVFFRPFVNFAVAMFIFLSGYLTKTENENWLHFIRKRCFRVLIPYIVWSIIYTLPSFSFQKLAFNLVTTKSVYTLYYVFVYIQLVILTPLLCKVAHSNLKWVAGLISPAYMLIINYLSPTPANNGALLILDSVNCLGWISYYYLGLLLGNRMVSIKMSDKLIFISLLIALALQMAEGYLFFIRGVNNPGTQMKLSAWLTSIAIMLLSVRFIKKNSSRLDGSAAKVITLIGDYSFGIYLSHVLVLNLLHRLSFYDSIPFVVNSLIVLAISFIMCWMIRKLVGDKVSRYLGII